MTISMVMTVSDYIDLMAAVSGYGSDDITSRCRAVPLPSLRWIVGSVLVERMGLSITRAAAMVSIDHATLLYGLRTMQSWSVGAGYEYELAIMERYLNALDDRAGSQTVSAGSESRAAAIIDDV